MPIFVFPAPFRVRLGGDQDAMTHRRGGFDLLVLPDNPVKISAVPAFETQRVSPAGSGTTFSPPQADQIYGARLDG